MAKKIIRPKKIKINESEYKIVSRSKSWERKHKALGQIHYDKHLIELFKNQPSDELIDSTIHEIMHGIIKEHEVKLDGRKEEALVTGLANGLTQVFRDNPNLLIWFYNKIQKP